MPELPEIEHLKRTLQPSLLGATVERVRVNRADVIRPGAAPRRPTSKSLLVGSTVVGLKRHGKQLALVGDSGRIACFHLGMSGQLRFVPHGARLTRTDHVHCIWSIRRNGNMGRLIFRDPRRFGGIWLFDDLEQLAAERWNQLGPDALTITQAPLHDRLRATQRPLKAALLDQSLIAGVGNIYADEALHAARLHPMRRSDRLNQEQTRLLARSIRATLRGAVRAGGSTLRDYTDGNGVAGCFVFEHAVYGRAGQPCRTCSAALRKTTIAQRTTVFCAHCQQGSRSIRKQKNREIES